MLNFFPHSTFDNDDMKSSKRQVTFLSLIFLLKCFSKSITILCKCPLKYVSGFYGGLDVVFLKQMNELCTSLQNRRYFFAFFRRARVSARRARSTRHARREGREKNNALFFSCPSRLVCLVLRARLALALARLKNAKK